MAATQPANASSVFVLFGRAQGELARGGQRSFPSGAQHDDTEARPAAYASVRRPVVLGPQAPLWLALPDAEVEPDTETEPDAEAEPDAEREADAVAEVLAEPEGQDELTGGGDVFMNPIHCGSQLTSAPGPT